MRDEFAATHKTRLTIDTDKWKHFETALALAEKRRLSAYRSRSLESRNVELAFLRQLHGGDATLATSSRVRKLGKHFSHKEQNELQTIQEHSANRRHYRQVFDYGLAANHRAGRSRLLDCRESSHSCGSGNANTRSGRRSQECAAFAGNINALNDDNAS